MEPGEESTEADTGTEEDTPDESLPPPAPVTEAPGLSGSVPEVIIFAGLSETVDLNPYFTGVVRAWAVTSSNPNHVAATMNENVAGEVVVRGVTEGISTVTVTATNDLGNVAQAFRVAVRGGTDSTEEGGIPSAESIGDAPEFTVRYGSTISIDLADYFSEGATGFAVEYDVDSTDGRIDGSVSGSVAKIRGADPGKIVVALVATQNNQRATRLVVVEVTPLPKKN